MGGLSGPGTEASGDTHSAPGRNLVALQEVITLVSWRGHDRGRHGPLGRDQEVGQHLGRQVLFGKHTWEELGRGSLCSSSRTFKGHTGLAGRVASYS